MTNTEHVALLDAVETTSVHPLGSMNVLSKYHGDEVRTFVYKVARLTLGLLCKGKLIIKNGSGSSSGELLHSNRIRNISQLGSLVLVGERKRWIGPLGNMNIHNRVQ